MTLRRLTIALWLAGSGLAQQSYRRLFLDALTVQEQSGLERVFHQPEKHPANPLIAADNPWERGSSGPYLYGTVLEENGKLRMWYHFIQRKAYTNAYAESLDGIRWSKPALGLIDFDGSKANNLVAAVTQDPNENPPRKDRGQCHNPSVVPMPDGRFAMFCYAADWDTIRVAFSSDGLRWTFVPETAKTTLFTSSDVVNFFRDPYRDRYVATWKGPTRRGRSVGIAVSKDGLQWTKPISTPVFTADDLDPPRTQIYGMPVFPYEGLYIGLPWIYHANVHYAPEMLMTREEAEAEGPLTVDVQLAWSWDLTNWTRPPKREPFLATGPAGAFDSKMIYTARAPVERDGKLYFYYGGFDKPHNVRQTNGAIGLATLRLDGFCSMRAGDREGWLVTHREKFTKGEVEINARTGPGGFVAAELLPSGERVRFEGDSVSHLLRLKGALPDNGIARIRFTLRNADLYSYRVR